MFASDPAAHGHVATFGTGRFEDNICSATQAYSDEFDSFRPVTAHRVAAPAPNATVSAAPKPHRSLAPWIVAIAVLALVAISGAGILLRRRAHASRVHA